MESILGSELGPTDTIDLGGLATGGIGELPAPPAIATPTIDLGGLLPTFTDTLAAAAPAGTGVVLPSESDLPDSSIPSDATDPPPTLPGAHLATTLLVPTDANIPSVVSIPGVGGVPTTVALPGPPLMVAPPLGLPPPAPSRRSRSVKREDVFQQIGHGNGLEEIESIAAIFLPSGGEHHQS